MLGLRRLLWIYGYMWLHFILAQQIKSVFYCPELCYGYDNHPPTYIASLSGLQAYRQADRHTYRCTDIQADRDTYTYTDRQTGRQTNVQTDRQITNQTNIQRARPTNIHAARHRQTVSQPARRTDDRIVNNTRLVVVTVRLHWFNAVYHHCFEHGQ